MVYVLQVSPDLWIDELKSYSRRPYMIVRTIKNDIIQNMSNI